MKFDYQHSTSGGYKVQRFSGGGLTNFDALRQGLVSNLACGVPNCRRERWGRRDEIVGERIANCGLAPRQIRGGSESSWRQAGGHGRFAWREFLAFSP
jgi:hypothetical protein